MKYKIHNILLKIYILSSNFSKNSIVVKTCIINSIALVYVIHLHRHTRIYSEDSISVICNNNNDDDNNDNVNDNHNNNNSFVFCCFIFNFAIFLVLFVYSREDCVPMYV